jgi:hypothetical protein
MRRTTVLLDDDLAACLELEKQRLGVSTAEVIRVALEAHLTPAKRHIAFAGLGRSGFTNTASDSEEILRDWALGEGGDAATRRS